jgi:hypothetical protein
MWPVEPSKLCLQHLLGEHSELHKFVQVFHGPKFQKYQGRKGQINPRRMKERHDELAEELIRRGGNHQSPYIYDCNHLEDWELDKNAIDLLINKCEKCKELILNEVNFE